MNGGAERGIDHSKRNGDNEADEQNRQLQSNGNDGSASKRSLGIRGGLDAVALLRSEPLAGNFYLSRLNPQPDSADVPNYQVTTDTDRSGRHHERTAADIDFVGVERRQAIRRSP